MTLIKRGTCSSAVVVSSSVYVCSKCGHTEMASNTNEPKNCPKCDAAMTIVNSQASVEDI